MPAAKAQGQRLVLGVLLLMLGLVVVNQLWPESAADAPATARPSGGRAAARAATSPPSAQVVDVQVAALRETPPAIASSGRNPFRFQVRQPPPPPPAPPQQRVEQTAPVLTGPPPPPPPPPITLKFIGVVTGEAPTGKVAVLSDGKFVYYGREGDIIEGRYRLVRIGEESVQMEHVDGRGRQTIRLSGA
ncbi:MAG: hypothetical protein AB7I50_03420 [Vicinamibacterales bacterium]